MRYNVPDHLIEDVIYDIGSSSYELVEFHTQTGGLLFNYSDGEWTGTRDNLSARLAAGATHSPTFVLIIPDVKDQLSFWFNWSERIPQ